MRILAATFLVATAACTADQSIGAVREHIVVDPQKLDVLFVMDNSSSMQFKRGEIAANIPRFTEALEDLPGGLPSLHVGIVTTDLGTAPYTVEQCGGDGDGGELQHNATVAGCTPPDGAYLSDEIDASGQRVQNYTGSLADAITCIGLVSNGAGCGFERPLDSMKRALGGTVADNAGFLRADAFLAVIIVSDEDDCSVSNPVLFNPAPEQNQVGSALGPFGSFRCTHWGVTCDSGPPEAPGTYQNCRPQTDSPYVADPATFVSFLTSIKDKQAIYVGVVAGDPGPFNVHRDGLGFSALSPSCTYDGGDADPAVRLDAFGQAFAPNYTFRSICEDDVSGVISAMGGDVREAIVSYTTDSRSDLAISYGCQAGGGAGAPGGLLLLLAVGLVVRKDRKRYFPAQRKY